MTPRELRELLHPDEAQADNLAWCKLDQYVHIAVRLKIFAKHRPKERQFPDMIAPSEFGDLLMVSGDPGVHASDSSTNMRAAFVCSKTGCKGQSPEGDTANVLTPVSSDKRQVDCAAEGKRRSQG